MQTQAVPEFTVVTVVTFSGRLDSKTPGGICIERLADGRLLWIPNFYLNHTEDERRAWQQDKPIEVSVRQEYFKDFSIPL